MYAAIHAPDFPVEAILRLEPDLRTKAVAAIDGRPPLLRVVSLNARARSSGIAIGMNRLEVEQFPATVAAIVIRGRSRAAETSASAAMLEAAHSISPRVEATASDTVILDIEGLEPLFGDHDGIARELALRIAQAGLQARIAIAANPDSAVLLARGCSGITIAASDEAARLAPLSIDALAPDAETRGTLARWGVRTLGALGRLPARQLTERMGQAGAQLRRLARGETLRPLVPCRLELHFEEALDFDDAIPTLEPLAFILNRLLDRLFQRLRSHGLATSELRLELERERPHAPAIYTLKMPLPARNPRIAGRLIMLELEAHPPGAPIIGVRIRAVPTRPRDVQNGLFTPLAPEPEKLELTLARIAAIVGDENVGSPEIQDSHARDRFAVRKFGGWGTGRTGAGELGSDTDFRAALLRREHGIRCQTPIPPEPALRLFRPPLDATVRIRDGVPAWLACSELRGDVEMASGPWRHSGEWWRPDSWRREEWDVEIRSNQRKATARIFRNVRTGRWYAEGIYD